MNKQQNIDSDECLRMEEEGGESKDCMGCSCNVCLLQTDYVDIDDIIKMIDEEVNLIQKEQPLMAMGMLHIKSKLSYVG